MLHLLLSLGFGQNIQKVKSQAVVFRGTTYIHFSSDLSGQGDTALIVKLLLVGTVMQQSARGSMNTNGCDRADCIA